MRGQKGGEKKLPIFFFTVKTTSLYSYFHLLCEEQEESEQNDIQFWHVLFSNIIWFLYFGIITLRVFILFFYSFQWKTQ